MRYLSAFFTFLFALILVLFASSNKDEVTLQLFPLPQEITAPLYLLTFLLVFVGFLAGGFVAWNAARKHRRAIKQVQKQVTILEGDLAVMKARAEAAEQRLAEAGWAATPSAVPGVESVFSL